jgi:hypothetical protein
MEELPVARCYHDAKVNEVGEGTSEVQRLMLASDLLGLGARSRGRWGSGILKAGAALDPG